MVVGYTVVDIGRGVLRHVDTKSFRHLCECVLGNDDRRRSFLLHLLLFLAFFFLSSRSATARVKCFFFFRRPIRRVSVDDTSIG